MTDKEVPEIAEESHEADPYSYEVNPDKDVPLEEKHWLSMEESGRYVGRKYHTINQLLHRAGKGEIRKKKLGRMIYLWKKDLMKFYKVADMYNTDFQEKMVERQEEAQEKRIVDLLMRQLDSKDDQIRSCWQEIHFKNERIKELEEEIEKQQKK